MMMVLLVVVLLAPASPGISFAVAPAAGDARSNRSKQHHHQQHHHHELESVIVITGDAANSATGTVCDGHLTQLLGVDVLAAYAAGTFSTLAAAVSHRALCHISSTMVVTGIKNSTARGMSLIAVTTMVLEIWYKAQ